jgi:hypothetical protein
MEKSMSAIQPSSLTDDELLRHAEDNLITASLDNNTFGLPLPWQDELVKRLRKLLDLADDMK